MKITRIFLAAGIALALTSILSCSSEKWNEVTKGFNDISKFNILQNSSLGFMPSEDIPDGESDFIDSVQISGNAISGGSTYITIVSSRKLQEIYLQIGEEGGYYRHIVEPEDETIDGSKYIYTIVLQFYQDLAKECVDPDEECEEINFKVSALAVDGEQAVVVEEEVPSKKAGSGALQVSLSWDRNDDVDLHVTTPSGETVSYMNRTIEATSGVGGAKLDIDSNAGCAIDGINSENIYFENPLKDGEYKVKVVLYSKCSGTSNLKGGARYNVTANVSGSFIDFAGDKQSGQFAQEDSYEVPKEIGTITIRNGQVQY